MNEFIPKPAKLVLRFSGASVINERISNDSARALARAIHRAQDQHKRLYHSKLASDDLADLLTALLIQHHQDEEQALSRDGMSKPTKHEALEIVQLVRAEHTRTCAIYQVITNGPCICEPTKEEGT